MSAGGLAVESYKLELYSVLFSSNTATTSSAGALSFGIDETDPGFLKVNNCTFTKNKSMVSSGGAIYLELVAMNSLTLQI